MANIDPKPIILNDVVLKIEADNYEANVSRIVLTPTYPQAVWKGMTPTAIKNLVGTPTWVCEITHVQDNEVATSLSNYLFVNAGLEKAMLFKPKRPTGSTTNATFAVNVVLLSGAIGGDIDTVPTATVTLPVNGQPVRNSVAA